MHVRNSNRFAPPIHSDAGPEKCCLACGEYWPMDTDFYERAALSRDGLSMRCRACIKEKCWRRTPSASSLELAVLGT